MKMNTKAITWFVTGAVMIIIIYSLYMAVQMSSTLPSIKRYSYNGNVDSFEDILINRIDAKDGWSYEKTETTGSHENTCYYATLTYSDNVDRFEYRIKFCSGGEELMDDECFSVFLIGAFDEVKNTGGYNISDSGVSRLVDDLDQTIFLNILPTCL